MDLIEWDKKYELGIMSIDIQHKRLVRWINRLDSAMKEGSEEMVIGEVIDKLLEYTATHFGYEEKIFDLYKYPEVEDHKEFHTSLIGQVKEFKEKIKSKNFEGSEELREFLKSWLINHILIEDKKYVSYLLSKGLK